MTMTLKQIVQRLRPGTRPNVDFVISDRGDGKGPHIERWMHASPRPSADEIAGFNAAALGPRYFLAEDLVRLLGTLPAAAQSELRRAIAGNDAVANFWWLLLSKGREPIDLQGATFPRAWSQLSSVLEPAIGQQGVDRLLAELKARARP